MSPPAVLLAVDDENIVRGVAASFEEEGVPLAVVAPCTAREAATRSPLGIGLAVADGRIVLALATGPDEPYAIGDDARTMGRLAARLAARRPLGAMA